MATKHLTSGRWHWGPDFAGYKVYVYEPGTSTAKSTYSDSALTTENTHPVTLDANGAGQIWFAGNAKIVVYTASGSVYQTDDNVNRSENSTATGNYNLVLNGSFEDDAVGDGVPDSWDLTLYTDGAFVVDTATQFHGQKSAKFTSVGTGGGYLTSSSTFAVRASKAYDVLFGIKSSVADVRNVVQVLWYKADGTASATASSTAYDESAANPTSWTAKVARVTVPSDAYFAKIRLIGCHNSDATSGVAWFDDVAFVDSVGISDTQEITGQKSFSLAPTGQILPSGVIMQYAGSSAPSGWLFCDGSAISRTTYANLFAVVSTTYGTGDGSTTFNLPNFKGRMPVGVGQGNTAEGGGLGTNRVRGATGGEETHTITSAEMPSHTHTFTTVDAAGATVDNAVRGGGANPTTATTSATGTGNAHENMSPFLVVNFIIKT